MNVQEMDSFLLDVRKSYRNLYLFNSRVKDIVKYIDFNVADFKFEAGFTKFCASPKEGARVKLNFWAWDWLGMYQYEFYFGNRNDVQFSIFLVSDSGFFDNEPTGAQKTDVDSFNAPEQSKSHLVFTAGKNIWWSERPDFGTFLTATAPTLQDKKNGNILLAKSYNLNQFIDQAATKNILTDFISFCTLHGITELQLTATI